MKAKTLDETLPFFVALFLFSMCIPLILDLGSLRLSVYRLVLVISFLPLVMSVASGRIGKLKFGDICVLLTCAWTALSFSVVQGVSESFETIGIFTIETFGAYFLGRCFVRSPEAFRKVIKVLFLMALCVAPFAIFETITGKNLALDVFDTIGRVFPDANQKPRRWGLDRVQGPFEHPILFGVFFGSIVGAVFYVLGYGRTFLGKWTATGTVSIIGAGALSSGPLAGLVAQYLFIVWDRVLARFKWRWYAFAGVALLAFIAVDLVSTRSPFAVFISYLAFNTHTAYNRLMIFEFGIQNIIANPIWGLGYGEWKRAWYMSTSFDMYWLIHGVRHGVLGLVLNFSFFLWAFFAVSYAQLKSQKLQAYRLGYIATLFGFFLSGWTVHFWNATYVLFLFFIGSGIWMLDYVEHDSTTDRSDETDTPNSQIVYSRFPRTKRHSV